MLERYGSVFVLTENSRRSESFSCQRPSPMLPRFLAGLLATVLAVLFLSACGGADDSPTGTEPATGDLEVSVSTTGDEQDTDGYTLTVDGSRTASIGPNGSASFNDLSVGDHQVKLSDVRANCTSEGENPRSVNVIAGESTSETFKVRCVETKFDRIAFTTDRDGNREIYTINLDGTGLFRVTEDTADDSFASWSPDGSRIAFHSDRRGNDDIYTISPDGTGLERVTDDSADDFVPAWSPDGSRIAFASDRNGNFDIYTIKPDGSGLEGVTDDFDLPDAAFPAWSPNGSRIVFAARPGAADFEILTISPDGTELEQVTDHNETDSRPNWSPDGSRIVFDSERDGNREIYTIDPDGTGLEQVTDDGAFTWGAAWSPDGSRIAFNSDRDGNHDIYLINPDGTGRSKLTMSLDDEVFPTWSLPR